MGVVAGVTVAALTILEYFAEVAITAAGVARPGAVFLRLSLDAVLVSLVVAVFRRRRSHAAKAALDRSSHPMEIAGHASNDGGHASSDNIRVVMDDDEQVLALCDQESYGDASEHDPSDTASSVEFEF